MKSLGAAVSMVGSLTCARSQSEASCTPRCPVAASAWACKMLLMEIYFTELLARSSQVTSSSAYHLITFSALALGKPMCVRVSRGDRFWRWILVGVGFFLGGSMAAMAQQVEVTVTLLEMRSFVASVDVILSCSSVAECLGWLVSLTGGEVRSHRQEQL